MNPLKILIVEDEALVATDLNRCLIDLGYHVAGLVDTGEEAVSQTLALRPDVVLMDIILKGPLNGIEAAGQIRTTVRPPPPVVFLTSHADEDTLQCAGFSEPFGYLVKPYEARALRAAIETASYRHHAEGRIREMERWLATTLRSIGDAVLATDKVGRVSYLNPMGETLTGWTLCEALGQPVAQVFRTLRAHDRQPIPDPVRRATQEGITLDTKTETLLVHRDGPEIPIDDSAASIRDDEGHVTGAVLVFRDATARKKQEAEREQMITELQEALANVTTLRGLLPICMYCKMIRDDKGAWHSVETYLASRSEAEFTHGMCPGCFEKQRARL